MKIRYHHIARLLTIVIVSLVTSMTAYPQSSIRQGTKKDIRKSQNIRMSIRKDIPTTQPQPTTPVVEQIADTVYSFSTKKQHGWFAPLGIIPEEATKHRYNSYRFTNRNSKGHWCKMEHIDAYGNLIPDGRGAYILKGSAFDTDSLANKVWGEKILTACIYETIADPSGSNVIQERAYDKEKNLVYSFSRTPIATDALGRKTYVGSYKDSYGLPAEMRDDPTATFTYGTLVMLTEDIWGNDSIVQYMDAKGRKRVNSDNVAMEVFITDKEGHLLKQQSRDSLGNLTIDNWGNCGVEYTWNKSHTIASATYMDDKWQPMRMPSIRATEGRDDVIKTKYKYDQYTRQTEEAYYTDNDIPDVNNQGIHKTLSVYDDRGNLIETRYLDLDGNLINNQNGWALYKAEFYPDGKVKDCFWYDCSLNPCSSEKSFSRSHYEYNDGNETLSERYEIINGEERIYSKSINTSSFSYQRWADGSFRIDSIDSRGRQTSRTFYKRDGSLEWVEGGAINRTRYFDDKGFTRSENIHYDENEEVIEIDGIAKTIELTDSLNHLVYIKQYTKNGDLRNTYIRKMSPDFSYPKGEYDSNGFGVITRAGGHLGYRYYKADAQMNQDLENPSITSLIGRDEFGEPDYIDSPTSLYYYQRAQSNGEGLFYDENDRIINDFDSLRNVLPKAISIEVTDSSAYKAGLRDNDVIILYGDYVADMDSIPSYYDFRKDWSLRSVMDSRKNKRMVVFRVDDAENNRYDLAEINNLFGTPSEIGFIPHIRYLTQRQKERIKSAISANMESSTPLLTETDFEKNKSSNGNNYIVMAYVEMHRDVRNMPYAKYITDPAVLLGAVIPEKSLYWDMSDGMNTQSFENMLDSRNHMYFRYPEFSLFLAKNTEEISSLSLYEKGPCTSWFDSYISDEDYSVLQKLHDKALAKMESKKIHEPHFPTSSLIGIWQIENSDSTETFLPTGYLNLKEDSTCQGLIATFGTIPFTEGTGLFKIERSYYGNWHHGDSLIAISPRPDDNLVLSCVGFDSGDEEFNEQIVPHLTTRCKSEKESFMKKMEYIGFQSSNDLFITSLSDSELWIDSGSETPIRFVHILEPDMEMHETMARDKGRNDFNMLTGEWGSTESDGTMKYLSLEADGTMTLEFDGDINQSITDSESIGVRLHVEIPGDWSVIENAISFIIDRDRLTLDYDFDLRGVDSIMASSAVSEIKYILKDRREEILLSLITGMSLESPMLIEDVSETALTLQGEEWQRVPSTTSTVCGFIEGDEGYLIDLGYKEGSFAILKWCDWDCSMTSVDYEAEFEKQRNNPKNIVLLKVESDEDGKDVFADIIELDCPPSMLGLHIKTIDITTPYFRKNILHRYNSWKRRKSSN